MARRAYAHDAIVRLRPGGSPNALGGAIANALCGGWDHPPPCPLAPHYVTNQVAGDDVTLRVLFATDAADERRVRRLIDAALAGGELTGPDGRVTTWRLKSTADGRVRPDEQDHAAALVTHAEGG